MGSEREAVDVYVDIGTKRQQHGAAVAELARRQSGVVTTAQLVALGMTPRRIGDLCRHGNLHRLHQGVYAVGHRRLTRDGWLTAALLAVGPDSFLSHRTAAAVHGLRAMNLRRIHVTDVGTGARSRSGLVIHRTTKSLTAGELTTVNGLAVSTVPRMLVDLAATETEQELTRLITVAVRKRAFAHDSLERALALHSTRSGISRLKSAYAAYRPHPDRKSELELAFDRLLAKHPEIPEPQRNVDWDRWELDYYWPDHNVVLELDGRPYHLAVQDIERDRLKDAKLLASGIQPMRVTDERFEQDPEGAIDDLKAVLRLR